MMKRVQIFTDGSCLGNPGPGGWAAILKYGEHTKELCGGFSRTTNNRMEIVAAIEALSVLKGPCDVTITTDSQYLRQAVEKRWLDNWMRNGWMTTGRKPVKNQDLWRGLHEQLQRHAVAFAWVKGHAGHPENERCDELARHCAGMGNLLPDDAGFVPDRPTVPRRMRKYQRKQGSADLA